MRRAVKLEFPREDRPMSLVPGLSLFPCPSRGYSAVIEPFCAGTGLAIPGSDGSRNPARGGLFIARQDQFPAFFCFAAARRRARSEQFQRRTAAAPLQNKREKAPDSATNRSPLTGLPPEGEGQRETRLTGSR
jgi:hypothetical protein